MNNSEPQFRLESDPLGEVRVPSHAMYGVQTRRALENFQISRLRAHPLLITAFVEIKKAAAEANLQTGTLDPDIAEVIIRAADELLAGSWHDQFDLDVFQAGAGTSYNMNVNEVIANRALEMLGRRRGEYERLNPNDHVNKAQSTNDTMPTAMRTAAVRLLRRLLVALDELTASLTAKADEFADVVKSGRTHLHDATAMTLGQEFGGYADNVARAAERLRAAEAPLLEIPLGGTAVGTGVNTHPDYARVATARLGEITGLALREARNRFQSMQSLGDFVALSGALRSLAIELSKIANDLRLLSSGPHTGLDEIELPAVQPGSSIMPGKVNPVIPEVVNMVCFRVIGSDQTVTMAAEAGQLQLNVFEPVIAACIFEAQTLFINAARTLREHCIEGITVNADVCRHYVDYSIGTVTALNPVIGYERATELATEAQKTGRGILELVREQRVLSEEQIAQVLDPMAMTGQTQKV